MSVEDHEPKCSVEIRQVSNHLELEDLVTIAQKLLEPRKESF